ncbi:MAG: cation-translocating P-type ATPase [Bacteroidota bacterium]
MTKKKPYALTIEEVFRLYKSREDGLTTNEAEERKKEYGPNKLAAKKQKSIFRLFVDQINNPVIYLLLVIVAISLFFNDFKEAIAIGVVIVLNTIIGFWMEYQAQQSIKALKKLDKLKAQVKREGKTKTIHADDLVPGDIILFESGDLVSADVRLIYSSELRVDESALTGESFAVEKNAEKIKEDTRLSNRKNMLYKGTAITNGKARGIVTATGSKTEMGLISEMVQQENKEDIPLNKKIKKLSGKLIWITLSLATLFFIVGWLAGKEVYLMFQTAVAWAVAAIPEGLAIVATIALARGMLKLSKKNVLVKKLAAVETLGETTVILTDKTGTLTENKLTLNIFEYSENNIHVEDINDQSQDKKDDLIKEDTFRKIMHISILCNDAKKNDGNDYEGDPLDISLIKFFRDLFPEETKKIYNIERINEDPFDSDSKFMGTIHSVNNSLFYACKGATEEVLNRSKFYLEKGKEQKLTDSIRKKWKKRTEELSSNGLKIIACSYKTTSNQKPEELQQKEDFIHDMVFIGLIGFIDPPRKDISATLKKCAQAGIKVVMVTGDHPGTAQNIAEQINLQEKENIHVMTGKELEEDPEDVYKNNVFARVDPKQKHTIVEQFKRKGEVTAMTGDGVNDAPALKKANIGIAMGKRGTQIAKETSDLVLKDDSFSSIVDAIQEGRIIFGNIRKFIIYQLSYHLAEILIIAGVSFSIFTLPLLPLQLLFLNLLSDVFPALALGLGKGNENIMNQKPKDPDEPIITNTNWKSIGIYGLIMALFITGTHFLVIFYFNESKEIANTITFFILAFTQLLHVFNMREPEEQIFNNQVTQNKYIWITIPLCFVILFTAYFTPFLSNALSFQTLSGINWLLVVIVSLSTITFTQMIKNIFKI